MKDQSLWPQQGRIWLAALCVAVFTALVGMQTPALAAANPGGNDDPNIRGLVEQMPAAGLVGAWVIDSVTYTTTDATEFEQENGAFALGSCVKATLTAVNTTTVTKLQTEPASDCDGSGGDDNGGGSGGGNGDGIPFYGLIEQMPGDGWVGVWIIGSQSFTTTITTVFEEDDGLFGVGACAKVITTVDGTAVTKVETEPAGDCDGNGGDDGGGDDGGGDDGAHGDGSEVYGLVESRPAAGPVGPWIIDGVTYTVTAQTELKTEYGPLEVGACVKAHLTTDNTNTVRELESERGYHCNGEGDDDGSTIGQGEFFGAIVTLPPGFLNNDLTGLWQVGNITVTANTDTEFQQENGLFDLGVYVKVEFVVDATGQFLATEIKTAITGGPHDGDDDGGDHDDPTDEGMTYGIIDTLPVTGLLGFWRIGGLDYQVDAATRLDDEGDPYAVGQQVKVEYRLDAAGNRLATEIERSADDGGVSDPGHTKLVGYVESMPTGTFVGDWQFAGALFVADANTVFAEEHGLLAEGAYVEAEYSSQGGVNVLHKVETRVPPGGGDYNVIGEIEDMGNGLALAAAGSTSWRIGGQTYQLTPATRISNNLALNSTVVVNSFIDSSGARVATRISSITLSSIVFLPLTQR